MSDTIKLRPEVLSFARAMEVVLQRNDYKGGWDRDTLPWLFAKLIEEVGEVGQSFQTAVWEGKDTPYYGDAALRKTMDELVDVANVAMMLRDRLMKILEAGK